MKLVERHPLWLRWNHWLNFPLLALMVWSGILIYWAHDAYPGFFPMWFYQVFKIHHHLAEGMFVHFTIAWLWVLNGFVYVALLATSRRWRDLFPDRDSVIYLVPTILHEIGLRKEKVPYQGNYNPAQRFAYTGVIALGVFEILTGFAIYKPVQLRPLTRLLGGYESAHLLHFVGMLSFCLFLLIHLIQVARAGWRVFQSMILGFEVRNETE